MALWHRIVMCLSAPSLTSRPASAPPPPARVAMVLPERERFTPDAAGAVSLALRDMARARDPAFDPVVFGRDPEGPAFSGCAFHALPVGRVAAALLGNRRAYARAACRALRAWGPGLVQVHNRPRLALAIAKAVAPVPVVLALHNLADTMPGGRTPAERQALEQRLDAIVCNSDFVRERFLDGLDRDRAVRVLTIHRGLPLAEMPPPLPMAARRREILFVGRLSPDKGADTFLRAAGLALPQLPGWSARMIGSTWFRATGKDSPFAGGLRPLAAAAGVEMAGFLENRLALRAMAEAAIVVLPSRWVEPFARVALEALACGAALIAAPRGGIPEAAGDAAVYADPEDPAALAEAMCRVAGDEALRVALQARGLAQAARFDVAETIARWATLRARLLAGRPG
jgi:UDP-glucose:(glucosyl)LPS alpha-1,2-glucosyltransferase